MREKEDEKQISNLVAVREIFFFCSQFWWIDGWMDDISTVMQRGEQQLSSQEKGVQKGL